MNKPVYLLPFIYVYRALAFIIKLSFKIILYNVYALILISYLVYKFLRYVIFGFSFPIVVLYRLLTRNKRNKSIESFTSNDEINFDISNKRISEVINKEQVIIENTIKDESIEAAKQLAIARRKELAAIEEEKRKKREMAKIEKYALEKQRKEEKKRLKEEKRAERKRKLESDVYKNLNVQREKRTFKDNVKAFFETIVHLPTTINVWIKAKYNNSTFVKNSKNKKEIERQALLIDFDGDDAIKSDNKQIYLYEAKRPDGKIIKDTFKAFSKVEVHSFLLSEGYEVYSIQTSKWINSLYGGTINIGGKMKTKDLLFFLTQLSTYIKSGITLIDSLRILARQYKKNKNYQKTFRMIIYDLTMGETFSEAMAKQGEFFPRLLINMIKTAEMTGELPEVLDDMANYYTNTEKTRKQMISALTYPVIILIVALAVVTFIMLFVVPKFVEIYESMDASAIPQMTLIVISISNFLEKYIIFILLGIAAVLVIYMYLYKNFKTVKTVSQWFFMHLPVVKNIIIYNEVTMFTKTFGSLLAHNVFITDSMEVLNKVTGNEIYKMLILDTISNLARGNSLSAAFTDHWAFPLPAYEMLVTGEKTGRLPEMMLKVSDYYQELHANTVARLKAFLEPILIIFLTVIVGFIVLAVVVPMFSMYGAVQ